jgi:hypothetical protein
MEILQTQIGSGFQMAKILQGWTILLYRIFLFMTILLMKWSRLVRTFEKWTTCICPVFEGCHLILAIQKLDKLFRFSNDIRKPDHSTSGHKFTIWIPESSGFRMFTVFVHRLFILIFFPSNFLFVNCLSCRQRRQKVFLILNQHLNILKLLKWFFNFLYVLCSSHETCLKNVLF